MQPPEHFDTERLQLRPVRTDDAPALFETYAGDPQATRFLSWRTHENVDQTIEFLEEAEANWDSGSEFVWAVVPRDERRPIGALGVAVGPHGVEVGYVLGSRWWGRGLMIEAVTAVMAWLQTQPGVYRIWAYCAVDHQRSARVLERAGMTYEATLRRWVTLPNLADEPCDALVYSWIRGDP